MEVNGYMVPPSMETRQCIKILPADKQHEEISAKDSIILRYNSLVELRLLVKSFGCAALSYQGIVELGLGVK
jgi:hypothetical protein